MTVRPLPAVALLCAVLCLGLAADGAAQAKPEGEMRWALYVTISAQWFDPGDELPKHEKFRPDTRGLEGTEPPDDSSMTGGARI